MGVWVMRSGLPEVLRRRGMTIAKLREELELEGLAADPRELSRLAEDRPAVGTLDMALVSRVCQALGVTLDELVHLEELRDEEALVRMASHRFPNEKQARLDALLDRGNAGQLSPAERRELDQLVEEFDELSLAAARAADTLRRLHPPMDRA